MYRSKDLALWLMLLAGCSAKTSKMDALFSARYITIIEAELNDKSWVQNYYSSDEINKQALRNRFVRQLVWLVDQDYYSYESSLFTYRSYMDTVTELSTLGLTTGAAFASGGTASILAAVAAGLTGSKAIVDRNVFNEISKYAVVLKMRALRASKLVDIERLMELSTESWSLESSIQEVELYRSKGSVVEALYSFAEGAGTDLKAQSERLLKAKLK